MPQQLVVPGLCVALVALLATPASAAPATRSPEGPFTIDVHAELRARRCVRFIVPDRGLVRECPVAVLGGARGFVRPAGPLLLHWRVQAGLAHTRNDSFVYTVTERGEIEPPFPINTGLVEVDLGVGLSSVRDILEGMVWLGPAMRFDALADETRVRLRELDLEPITVGELVAGVRVEAQFAINAGDWVRIGGRGGVEVLGSAASVWSSSDTSAEFREEFRRVTGLVELRTLGAIVAAIPPEGPAAFVADLGFSTGWAFPAPAARAALDEAGIDVPGSLTLWPEARLLLGIRLRPGQ